MELGIWELAKVSEFARSAGGRKWNREFRNPGFARSAGGRKWNREFRNPRFARSAGGRKWNREFRNPGFAGLQGALGAGSGIGNFGILGLQGALGSRGGWDVQGCPPPSPPKALRAAPRSAHPENRRVTPLHLWSQGPCAPCILNLGARLVFRVTPHYLWLGSRLTRG